MNLKLVAGLCALPLLAACAPEIESTVYLADVLQVVQDGGVMAAPAILRVPQSSEDGCKKGLANLVANLGTLAPVSGKAKCIEKDGDQLAEIETMMMVTLAGSPVPDKNLFVLTVDPVEDGTFELSFGLTRTLDEVVKVLATNSDELQADFDPAKFIFTLTNNAFTNYTVVGNTVFIDEKPALPEGTERVELDMQTSVEVVFSDVAAAYAEAGNPYRFVTLTAVD